MGYNIVGALSQAGMLFEAVDIGAAEPSFDLIRSEEIQPLSQLDKQFAGTPATFAVNLRGEY
jgi:hypothetical protein